MVAVLEVRVNKASQKGNQDMYEISPSNGFGPIKFGFTPSEVKSVWGSELVYEDWMGGNLENFLFFRGLLIGFRGKVEDHPSENSYVCMFQVKTIHPLQLWGKEITSATMQDIQSLLNANNLSFKVLPNGIVQCIEQELQFHFNQLGILDEVDFADGRIIGADI